MSGFNPGNNDTKQNQPKADFTSTSTDAVQPTARSGSILGGSSFFGNISNNPTIIRAVDIMRNWLAEVGEKNLEVVPIDGATYGLRMSGIALTYPWQSATKNAQLYLTQFILFEETLPERGKTQVVDVGGQQQQLVVTADDWVTGEFLGRLAEVVKINVKNPSAEITTVGFDIVNRQITANVNETAIYSRMVQMAGESFAHYIEYGLGEKAREKNSLKEILSQRFLSLNIDTSGMPEFDYQDQPVRNDFTMTVSAKENRNTDPNAGLFDTGVIPMTSTSGYIDVAYFDMTEAERMNYQYGQQFGTNPAQFQRFTATAVITDIQSLRGIWDIDSIVNALLSVVALTQDNQWAALLQRRFSNSSGARLRDVGYLALEVDPEHKVIDTGSTAYDEYTHMRTINTLFRSKFDFAIDLPRKSVYGYFRQLLRGSVDANSPSYRALIKALNEYTNGYFPLNFNQEILGLEKRPVLLGSYAHGAHGASRHDLRDYQDYLTVLTQIGTTDINTVKEFDSALAGDDGRDLSVRTNTVLNVIERIAGEVNLTGKGDRYLFNPVFMQTLVSACKQAGVNIQTRTLGAMNTSSSNRRTTEMFSGSFSMQGQNIFNSGHNVSGIQSSSLGGGIDLGFGMK